MADTLTFKIGDFLKALKTLDESLAQEKDEFIQDSVIVRFQYTFELCWKTVKLFLYEKHGVNVNSPKDCFRELRRNSLLTDEETETLNKMVDARNEIVHTYQEAIAEALYERIKNIYRELLWKVYQEISK